MNPLFEAVMAEVGFEVNGEPVHVYAENGDELPNSPYTMNEEGQFVGWNGLIPDTAKFVHCLLTVFTTKIEPWKPKVGDLYYFVTPDSGTVSHRRCERCLRDMERFSAGNCFRTEEKAERNMNMLREKIKEFFKGKDDADESKEA